MAIDPNPIKAAAIRLGFDLVGVCGAEPPSSLTIFRRWLDKGYAGTMAYLWRSLGLRADPQRLLPGARSAIAVGCFYDQPNPPERGMPRIARYALGRDYHKVLRPRLRALERELVATFPSARSRICVDSAPILEREYAQRAGLGWYGKNTCLINSRRGSWFVIGLLLTTVELEPDEPARGGCGSCTRCVEACPTGCIVFEDGRWQINAERCISYLTIEHRGPFSPDQERLIGPWTFGCDVCQEVCPFNEIRPNQPLRAPQARLADFRRKRSWPSLRQLAVIQEPEWDLLTRGSPVRRAGFEGLRRNARANLDNAAAASISSAPR
jgi:epoxyqueuosine reductase